MGTRGSIVFVAEAAERVCYQQYDSYPDGVGENVLKWLTTELSAGREADVKQKVIALKPVDQDGEPTVKQREKYAKFTDGQGSSGRDWYATLRRCQGDPALILQAGIYGNAADFVHDSLFCEWAYVVDLDERVFEVYQGFRTSPPTQGRWVGRKGESTRDDYHAVQRIARFSFDALPEDLVGIVKEED